MHPLRAWPRAASSRHHCSLKTKFFALFRAGVGCSHIFIDDSWGHIKGQRNQQFAYNEAYLYEVVSSASYKLWPWCSNTVVSPEHYRAGLWAEVAIRLMCAGNKVPHPGGSPSLWFILKEKAKIMIEIASRNLLEVCQPCYPPWF